LLHGQLLGGIHLVCVHLGLFEKERRLQTEMLIDYIQDSVPADAPLLVAGDFNDWRQRVHTPFAEQLGLKEVYRERWGRAAKTFPAMLPLLAMDRIYARGFAVNQVQLIKHPIWREISDHCAVVADLTLKNTE